MELSTNAQIINNLHVMKSYLEQVLTSQADKAAVQSTYSTVNQMYSAMANVVSKQDAAHFSARIGSIEDAVNALATRSPLLDLQIAQLKEALGDLKQSLSSTGKTANDDIKELNKSMLRVVDDIGKVRADNRHYVIGMIFTVLLFQLALGTYYARIAADKDEKPNVTVPTPTAAPVAPSPPAGIAAPAAAPPAAIAAPPPVLPSAAAVSPTP